MDIVNASFLSYIAALVVSMWLWHQLIQRLLAARGLANRVPPDPVEVRSKILPVYFGCGAIWLLGSMIGIGVAALLAGANWPLISGIAGVASVPIISAFSARDTLKLIEKPKRSDHAA